MFDMHPNWRIELLLTMLTGFFFPFHQVGAGLECGIGVDDFDEWEEGDVVEAFNTVKKARTLEEASATVTAALKGAGVQLQNWQ